MLWLNNYVLQADFVKAAGDVRTLTNVPDADLLTLYGLFKQGVHGDNSTEKPGFLDFKGKAKWEAWTKNKGVASVV